MLKCDIAVSSSSSIIIFYTDISATLRIYVSTIKGEKGILSGEGTGGSLEVTGLSYAILYYVTVAKVVNGIEIDSVTKERVLFQSLGTPAINIPNWIFIGEDGTIYGSRAGTNASRLVKSTDFGNTWTLLHDFVVQIHGIFVTSKGTILQETSEGNLYRSQDGGQTWGICLTFTRPEAQAYNWSFTEDYDGYVYCSQYGNVMNDAKTDYVSIAYLWRSHDDGLTWTRIDYFSTRTNKHIHRIIVDKYTNRLYVSIGDSNKRLYYSDDHGDTWSLIGIEGVQTGFTGITLHKGTRFFSDDLAPSLNSTWKTNDDISLKRQYTPNVLHNTQMYSMVSFEDGELWSASFNEWQQEGNRSALFRSQDGGQTWEVYASVPGIPSYHSFCYLAYDRWGKSDLPYLFCNGPETGLIRILRAWEKPNARARQFKSL